MKIIKVGVGILTLLAAINRYRGSMQQMVNVQHNLQQTADQIDKPRRIPYGSRNSYQSPSRYRTEVRDNDRAEWEQRMRSRSY
ncbi:MAG: hypothetical protein U0Q16_00125 [Bryobacteraceae bacterium]